MWHAHPCCKGTLPGGHVMTLVDHPFSSLSGLRLNPQSQFLHVFVGSASECLWFCCSHLYNQIRFNPIFDGRHFTCTHVFPKTTLHIFPSFHFQWYTTWYQGFCVGGTKCSAFCLQILRFFLDMPWWTLWPAAAQTRFQNGETIGTPSVYWK